MFRAGRPGLEMYLREQITESWYGMPMPPACEVEALFRDFRVPLTYEATHAQNQDDIYDQIGWMGREVRSPSADTVDHLFRTEVLDPFVASWAARCRAAHARSTAGPQLPAGSTLRLAPATYAGIDRAALPDPRMGGSLGVPLHRSDATRGARASAAEARYGAVAPPVPAATVQPNYGV